MPPPKSNCPLPNATDWKTLQPYPGDSVNAVDRVNCHAAIDCAGMLTLQYEVVGRLRTIIWPQQQSIHFARRLWTSTCLEFFIRKKDEAPYLELNLSPSGAWAAYEFEAYREGAQDRTDVQCVSIKSAIQANRATLRAELMIREIVENVDKDWITSFTAVIQSIKGEISYWALTHPTDRPDFHDKRGFIAPLAPRRTA